MKSVNKVTLLGNVTRDPERKETGAGQSVCTFGLATNRVWKSSTGEKQSLPEYHNIVAWGGLADFCAETITKGKPLYIEGYLKTRSWDSPEGTKVFRTEIVAENIILLGPRGYDDGNGSVSTADQTHSSESHEDLYDPLGDIEGDLS